MEAETTAQDRLTRSIFRLPWTASDNAMTWLEPTRRCNITCDACFAKNDPNSEKPLEQIRAELEAMQRMRRCDAMLIAGGEPLTHPGIEGIVRIVKEAGPKPVIVTNGVNLDGSLARRLKRAGAFGFTIHVDSHQARPGWVGANEKELNALRSEFAELLHDVGGLNCAFNTTVFPDALQHVPDVVRWAVERPRKVHILTLICVRMASVDGPFSYYAGDRPVDIAATPYATSGPYRELVTEDLLREIEKVLPGFRFCAYLGGTVHALAPKWVVGCRFAAGAETLGYLGPRAMEVLQNASHVFRRRFLAYSSPRESRMGRAALALGVLDASVRAAAWSFARAVLKRPARLFRGLQLQSISVVQPADLLPNGEMDTCDGCPNRTFWEGRLVPACRLDEYQTYGVPLRAVPRRQQGA